MSLPNAGALPSGNTSGGNLINTPTSRVLTDTEISRVKKQISNEVQREIKQVKTQLEFLEKDNQKNTFKQIEIVGFFTVVGTFITGSVSFTGDAIRAGFTVWSAASILLTLAIILGLFLYLAHIMFVSDRRPKMLALKTWPTIIISTSLGFILGLFFTGFLTGKFVYIKKTILSDKLSVDTLGSQLLTTSTNKSN